MHSYGTGLVDAGSGPKQLAGRRGVVRTLAALVTDQTRNEVQSALRSVAAATFVDNAQLLTTVTKTTTPDLTIVELGIVPHNESASLIRLLRSRTRAPIVAFVRFERGISEQISAACHAGAAFLAVGDTDELLATIHRVFAHADRENVSRRIAECLAPVIPPRLVRPVLYCLRHQDRPLTTSTVASAIGVSRRTLLNRFLDSGWPPPSAVIGWIKLMTAALLLQDPKRTVSSVASEVGFQSDVALRLALKRRACLHGMSENREQGLLSKPSANYCRTAFRLPCARNVYRVPRAEIHRHGLKSAAS